MTCHGSCCMQGGDESDFSDDDVWAGDERKVVPAPTENKELYGEGPTEAEHVDTTALRRKHAKQGYVDGLVNAKEGSMQAGFDSGYGQGAVLGEKAGEILATLKTLAATGDADAAKLYAEAKVELGIQNVLSLAYFDENLDGGEHKVIAKWEAIARARLSD